MPHENHPTQENISCSFCHHHSFRNGGSKHSSDLAGTPLNLLQPKCSKCLCKTRLIEVRQLCQLAYKVCQEESQCLLSNTGTKSSLPNEIEKSW